MSTWTMESDIQLINLVKKYDMFYNPKSSNYRNLTLKTDVWKRIGSILDKADEDCSKRWAYVRSQYVRRRNKPVPKKLNPVIRQGLKRARLLKFLDQYGRNGIDSFTNDSSTDQSVNEPASSEISYDNDVETDDGNDVDTEIVEIDYKTEVVEIDYKNEVVELEDDDFHDEKLTITDKKDDFKEDSGKRTNDIDIFDETDHFFASMAKIAKKLPRRDQVVLRMQISTMVGNAELKQMDGSK